MTTQWSALIMRAASLHVRVLMSIVVCGVCGGVECEMLGPSAADPLRAGKRVVCFVVEEETYLFPAQSIPGACGWSSEAAMMGRF